MRLARDDDLVIINNLYIGWPRRFVRPREIKPPFIVDANAVLALAVANQRLKAIAGQCGKVLQRGRRLQAVELQARRAFKTRECLDAFARREVSRSLVTVTDDH